MYSSKKVNLGELTALKRDLDGLQYVCGSNLKDVKENTKNFVRENLDCRVLIEIPYFSVDKYPKVCVYCGRKDMLLEKQMQNIYHSVGYVQTGRG